MPRRSTQAAALVTPAASTPRRDASIIPVSDDPFHAELTLLRRQWKWAAFSQFFYTFATLFAMPDVSLTDIEDDLTRSTSIVLPRVMHRLLITATQDRKLSLDNWQTSLRKQYMKRDPEANPIGLEPVVQLPTPSPEYVTDEDEPKSELEQSAGPLTDAPRDDSQEPKPDVVSLHGADLGNDGAESGFTVSRAGTVQQETKASSEKSVPHSAEESKDWLQLPMLTKLDSLHLLTEWQFHNVHRLRTLMKSDDETAEWRIKPIGYDAKTNAYWLIGPDRLWIQHVLPKPPKSHKRKRPPHKTAGKSKRATKKAVDSEPESDNVVPASKKRKVLPSRNSTTRPAPSTPTPARTTSGHRQPRSVEETPTSGRGSRAAKTQANKKLDAQAKELAELQRQAALEGKRAGKRSVTTASPSPRKPTGTRASARLRGAIQEEVWQEIPDEWLAEGEGQKEGKASGSRDIAMEEDQEPEDELATLPKTGLESDDDAISDLTELSDASPPPAPAELPEKRANRSRNSRKGAKAGGRSAGVKEESLEAEVQAEPEEEPEPEWRPPDDFVEWETLCVTLYEWEHICERFEGATHYAEKALHKLLSNYIVPAVTGELREIERKRRLEEAVTQRKRSSRLAVKETEKETARLAAIQKAEDDEKLSRTRRLEARLKKEEEEREKRETAREKRRAEREEREERIRQKREREENPPSKADTPTDVVGDEQPRKPRQSRQPRKSAPAGKASTSTSGSRTPVGEDWILDCEICFKKGVNVVENAPLLCCGRCSKWQHIACHDHADRSAGRPKRDWDVEEFVCRNCRLNDGAGRTYVPNGLSSYGAYPQATYQRGIPGPSAYAVDPRYDQTASSSSRPSHAITFTHYQPQQHGFSSTHTSQAQVVPPAQTYAPPYGYDAAKSMTQYHNSRSSDHVSPPQFVPRPYGPNNVRWPSTSQPPMPQSALSWSGPSTNGYAHQYNSSAERSSVAPPSYQPNGVGGPVPPPNPDYPPYWQRPQSTYNPPPGQPIGNPYPQEQYHYSRGSQPPQHRAP